MAKVVVLSRAGRASLPEAVLGALEVRHTVRFAQRHTAPERHEAASLLRDAKVLASTNVTLPVLDDGLLDQLDAKPKAQALYHERQSRKG